MSRSAHSDRWDHTSELWALTAEIHRDRKERTTPFTADDIHPYRGQRQPEQADEPKATPEEIKAAEDYARMMNHAMDAPDDIVEHVIRMSK